MDWLIEDATVVFSNKDFLYCYTDIRKQEKETQSNKKKHNVFITFIGNSIRLYGYFLR